LYIFLISHFYFSPWCLTNLVSPKSFSHLAVMELEKEYITLNTVGDMIVMTGGAGYTEYVF